MIIVFISFFFTASMGQVLHTGFEKYFILDYLQQIKGKVVFFHGQERVRDREREYDIAHTYTHI